MTDGSTRRHCASYLPCRGGKDFSGESLLFDTDFFHSLKAETSIFIVYTKRGNSSRVTFRIGIKLPRALRGCFVEGSYD